MIFFITIALSFLFSVEALNLKQAGFHEFPLSLAYFLLASVITFFRPVRALQFIIFLLPIATTLHMHTERIIDWKTVILHNPGTELVLGFILGYCAHLAKKREFLPAIRLASFFSLLLSSLLFFSAALGVLRNLWQSGSYVNRQGLLLNLSILRVHVREKDDFFPLREYFFYLTAIIFCVLVRHLCRNLRGKKLAWEKPFAASIFCMIAFAVIQHFYHIGFSRDGWTSLSSFMPDLHAFGGFLLAPFCLSLYFLTREAAPIRQKLIAVTSLVAVIYGIWLSQARSAMLFVLILPFGIAIFRNPLRLSRNARVGIFAFLGVIAAVVAFKLKLRGISFAEVAVSIWQGESFRQISDHLGSRPEIFLEALRYIFTFPFTGLGMGLFFRTSSLDFYSSSPFLMQYGGENAHNYFLQVATEWGLPIFFLSLVLGISVFLKSRRNIESLKIWILLAGIGLGNLYAHSLLIKEVLLFATLFFALILAQIPDELPRLPLNEKNLKYRTFAVCLIAALIFRETWLSFNHQPFRKGSLCTQNRASTFSDGWTNGVYRILVKYPHNLVRLRFIPGHPFIDQKPLKVKFLTATDGQKNFTLLSEETYKSNEEVTKEFSVVTSPGQQILVVVEPQRCYTPRNLGINIDGRRLGFQLLSVDFFH